MKIIRALSCTPDELFGLLESRFSSECAEHGTPLDGPLGAGSGYEDDRLGISVRILELERPRVIAWRSGSVTGEVVSRYEMLPCSAGCRVEFSREWPGRATCGGRMTEALILGRMANELIELGDAARAAREDDAGPKERADSGVASLSQRILRSMIDRIGS